MATRPGRSQRPRLWVYAALGSWALVSSFPFVWMLLSSFMTRGETLRRVMWPERVQWANYLQAWREADFGLYFRNSLVISAMQCAGNFGNFVGPLIVGYLADMTGSYLPGFIISATLSLSLLVAGLLLPETGPKARKATIAVEN